MADELQWSYTPQPARRAGLLRDDELGGGGSEERCERWFPISLILWLFAFDQI
jgi:hypothetical protein